MEYFIKKNLNLHPFIKLLLFPYLCHTDETQDKGFDLQPVHQQSPLALHE